MRGCFTRLFEAHGLPLAIRSNNGPPFASARGPLGLTRLSAEWLAMGIDLERGRPGCPQDNGTHERMRLDIRNELEAGRIGRDKSAFDLWREDFNVVRPHQALGMRCPAEVYEPSSRIYQGLPLSLDYGAMEVRRVNGKGMICYRRERSFLSESIGGWDVGLAPVGDDLVEVRFANLLLGHLEPKTASFRPLNQGDSNVKTAKRVSRSLPLPRSGDDSRNQRYQDSRARTAHPPARRYTDALLRLSPRAPGLRLIDFSFSPTPSRWPVPGQNEGSGEACAH